MKEPGEGRAVDSEGGKRLRKEIISFSERPNVVMTAALPGPWRWAPEQEQFQQSGGWGQGKLRDSWVLVRKTAGAPLWTPSIKSWLKEFD